MQFFSNVEVLYLEADKTDLFSRAINFYLNHFHNEPDYTHTVLKVFDTYFDYNWYGMCMYRAGSPEAEYIESRVFQRQYLPSSILNKVFARATHIALRGNHLSGFKVKQAFLWLLSPSNVLTCTGYVQYLLGLNITNPTPMVLFWEVHRAYAGQENEEWSLSW